MSKFCKYCGTLINDGEEHVCQNASAGNGIDVTKTINSFVADAVAWFKGEIENVGIVTSGIFTVLSYLLNSLFFVFAFVSLSGVIKEMVGGYFNSELPSGISFWYGLLILIVSYAITFALDVCNKVVSKEKIYIAEGLSKAATTSLVCSATLFVGGLLSMIAWWLCVPFILIAVVYRVSGYWTLTTSLIKVKNTNINKYIVVAIVSVLLAVGLLITGSCIKGYIENIIGSAYSALSGIFF